MNSRRPTASRLLPILLALGGLAGACGGSTPHGATTPSGESASYPIHLQRAHHVGERYLVVDEVTQREQRTVTVSGQVVEDVDQTTTVRLAAAVQVLEVDANGKAVRLRYQVQSCERTKAGEVQPLLRHGQVVEVETAATRGEARMTIDGAPATDEQLEALDAVITLTRSAKNDDALFGSTTPRAAGETWQPDFAAIAESLSSASPFRLDAARMSGSVRLVERRNEGPVPGLVVEAEVDAVDARMNGLPPGTNVRRGELRLEMGGFFPLDEAMPPLVQTTGLAVALDLDVPTPQGTADMTVRVTMQGQKRIEPVR